MIFYAVIPLGGDVEYITSAQALARRGAALLHINGYGAYGPPSGSDMRSRTVTGPLMPAPGSAFISYESVSYGGAYFTASENVTFYGQVGASGPILVPPELILEFDAPTQFDPAFSTDRTVTYFGDGGIILKLNDMSGSYTLNLNYLKVWAAVDGTPPASDFWTDFILAREVP